MRLLNTTTGRLEWYAAEHLAPKYAILSHRWEEQEVVFRDLLPAPESEDDANIRYMRTDGTKKGYYKIYKACQQARREQLQWLWADTCCIDKSDSSELSEAINSMFRWYKNATKCYVYLSDAKTEEADSFNNSIWFKRGWTLQELLAPKDEDFYDSSWRYIGNKKTLAYVIAKTSGIREAVLDGTIQIWDESIAMRMSWASQRETTRLEDNAYCLLGIFDVTMDLRYGEQGKAFLRLQEEIIRQDGKNDPSIFASSDNNKDFRGLLAGSPVSFQRFGDVRRWPSGARSAPIEINNRGIKTSFRLLPHGLSTYLAVLECYEGDWLHKTFYIGIYLRHYEGTNEYVRIRVGSRDCHWIDMDSEELQKGLIRPHDVLVLHDRNIEEHSKIPVQTLTLRVGLGIGYSGITTTIFDEHCDLADWNDTDLAVRDATHRSSKFFGSLQIELSTGACSLILGLDAYSNPIFIFAAQMTSQSHSSLPILESIRSEGQRDHQRRKSRTSSTCALNDGDTSPPIPSIIDDTERYMPQTTAYDYARAVGPHEVPDYFDYDASSQEHSGSFNPPHIVSKHGQAGWWVLRGDRTKKSRVILKGPELAPGGMNVYIWYGLNHWLIALGEASNVGREFY